MKGLGWWPRFGLAQGACQLLTCQIALASPFLDAFERAQQCDPIYQSAQETLAATQQRLPEARAALLPQLSATGDGMHVRDRTEFSGSPPEAQRFKQYNWSVDLVQPVIQFDDFFAYREASAVVRSAEAQFAAASQDLIIRFAGAYFDVAVAEEALEAARQQEKSTEEQFSLAQKGFSLGTHAVTDAYEAKSRAASARAQRVGAENDLENKLAELEKLLGETPAALAVLKDSAVPPRPNPESAKAWMDTARNFNPAVLAQRANWDAATEEIRRSRSDHLPTASLTASYGGTYAGASTTSPFDYSSLSKGRQVGVRVSVPLFSGGGIDAKVVEAIANRDKAAADLETARRRAAADAREAYSGYQSGVVQAEALRTALDAGVSAVRGNQQGYHLGIRINSDVLAAEQQLYVSRRDFARARYDALLNGLKLKAAAGTLTIADVIAIDALFARSDRPVVEGL